MPSILTVAPSGMTKRDISGLCPRLRSAACIVKGMVAAELLVEKARS